jgi:hypothetical protein
VEKRKEKHVTVVIKKTRKPEENTESDDYESKKHMEYHKIIINSTGCSTEDEDEYEKEKVL